MSSLFPYLVFSADSRRIVSEDIEEAISLAEIFRGSRLEARVYIGSFNLKGENLAAFPPSLIKILDPEDRAFDREFNLDFK